MLSDEKAQNLNTEWISDLCYYENRMTKFTQEIRNRIDSLYLYR